MDGLCGQERLWGGKQSQQISDKADTHKAWGRDLGHNIEKKGLLAKDLGDNREPLMVSQQPNGRSKFGFELVKDSAGGPVEDRGGEKAWGPLQLPRGQTSTDSTPTVQAWPMPCCCFNRTKCGINLKNIFTSSKHL